MLFDCKLIDTMDSKGKGTVNLMHHLSQRTNTEYESDMVYTGSTTLLLHYPSVKPMLSGGRPEFDSRCPRSICSFVVFLFFLSELIQVRSVHSLVITG
jgi:hypothetical protein